MPSIIRQKPDSLGLGRRRRARARPRPDSLARGQRAAARPRAGATLCCFLLAVCCVAFATSADGQEPGRIEDRVSAQGEEPTRLLAQELDRGRIETRLAAVFGERLRSEKQGAQRVYRLYSGGRRQATFIFDDRRDGILVTSSARLVPQLNVLFEALGRPSADVMERRAVISIERTEPSRLRRAIEAYRRSQAPQPRPNDSSQRTSQRPLALVNFVVQNSDDVGGVRDGDAPDPQQPQPERGVRPGGLDGDVDVQMLPDLDVIIFRGRERDVRKLTEIVQELERLSQETQPQVQVYELEHANSEAVAEVLREVSEDLTGRRQGRVNVTPLTKPNAILLIGWGDAVQAMLDLIRQLDTPVSPGSQFPRLPFAACTRDQCCGTDQPILLRPRRSWAASAGPGRCPVQLGDRVRSSARPA